MTNPILNTESNHAVIILASGLSIRLGQPKQLLKKAGKPLIIHTIEQALKTKPRIIIIIKPASHTDINRTLARFFKHGPFVKTAHSSLKYHHSDNGSAALIIDNFQSSLGMAHSLKLGIDVLKAEKQSNEKQSNIDRVLIVGVDQVCLDDAHLIELLTMDNEVIASQYPKRDADFNIKYSEDTLADNLKDSIIGLPIVIHYDLLKAWQSSLKGDKGLRYHIRSLPKKNIATVRNPQLSFDIDTPTQLDIARQRGWLDVSNN